MLGLLVVLATAETTLAMSYPKAFVPQKSVASKISLEVSKTAPISPMVFGDKDQLTVTFRADLAYVYQGTLYLPFEWEWSGLPELADGGDDAIVIAFPWEMWYGGYKHLFYEDEPRVYAETVYGDEYKVGNADIIFRYTPEKYLYYNGRHYKVYYAFIRIPVGDDLRWGRIWVAVTPKTDFNGIILSTSFKYVHNWDYNTPTLELLSFGVGIYLDGDPVVSGVASWTVGQIVGGVLGWGKGMWDKTWEDNIEYSTTAYPWKSTPPWPPCSPGGICPTSIRKGLE